MGAIPILLLVLVVVGAAAFIVIRRRQSQSLGELPPPDIPDIGNLPDYTSEPLEEPQNWRDRVGGLSSAGKVLIGVLLLIVLGTIGIAVLLMLPQREPPPPPPPPPQITINEANLINPETINVLADTTLPGGTQVMAALLENGKPINWVRAADARFSVRDDGTIDARLGKGASADTPVRGATHAISLTAEMNGQKLLTQKELFVPIQYRDSFAPPPRPTAEPPTPTPEEETLPTATPELPTATPEPVASGGVDATVGNGGFVRAGPSLETPDVGQVVLNDKVQVLQKTADNGWFQISTEQGLTGWTGQAVLLLPPEIVSQIPVQGANPAPTAEEPPAATESSGTPPPPTGLRVTVVQGGNIRTTPSFGSNVIDPAGVNAGEEVELLEKTSDGVWYRVRNPRDQVGWTHNTLLAIPPAIVGQVPVAQGQ